MEIHVVPTSIRPSIHTDIHTDRHTYVRTYMHTYIHTSMHAYIHYITLHYIKLHEHIHYMNIYITYMCCHNSFFHTHAHTHHVRSWVCIAKPGLWMSVSRATFLCTPTWLVILTKTVGSTSSGWGRLQSSSRMSLRWQLAEAQMFWMGRNLNFSFAHSILFAVDSRSALSL